MQYRTQVARDLDWVICSPSLLEASLPEEFNYESLEVPDALKAVDEEDLHEFLASRQSRRVGHYFENLVEFWVERVLRYKMLACQQQYYRDGQTIGELDFVYEDNHGIVTHLETAVKFYLHYSVANAQATVENLTGSHLVGPNASDNFEKKTARLFGHQLPLGIRLFTNVQRQFAFVKGRIFHHINDSARIPSIPSLMADSCLRGLWLRETELEQLSVTQLQCNSENEFFRLQQKPFWLADDMVAADSDTLLSRKCFSEFVLDHFRNASHPLLFSVLEKRKDACIESNRLFVVSEQWPRT